MSGAASWLGLLLATDAPALPAAWAMQAGLSFGWALVLGAAATTLTTRMALPVRRALALGLMLWSLLPGPLSPHYWLGLAFQLPSLSAMLLCAWYLQRTLWAAAQRPGTPLGADAGARAERRLPAGVWMVLLPAVLLGYALLLDTFAVLPLQLYAWGFSPALLLVLLALALLPWGLCASAAGVSGRVHWIAPAALLLFALTRLPSGNVWDALLDPWLWLLLQGLLVRDLYRWLRPQVGRL
jgi:hypothetical protein